LGSKNRIFLGMITSIILHHCRSYFTNDTIFMSKRVQSKIRSKHKDVFFFTESGEFAMLLENVIGVSPYEEEECFNFITYVKERYILFSLKQEKHHVFCPTIYNLNDKTLKKYILHKEFKLFRSEYKAVFEEIIANQVQVTKLESLIPSA